MNNHQIEVILKKAMGKKFRGVFASDVIPPITPPITPLSLMALLLTLINNQNRVVIGKQFGC
jgi:hypothetical protein